MAEAKDRLSGDVCNVGSTTAVSGLDEGAESSRIKSDIDNTRARMDETIADLSEQLNPRHLLNEVLDLFRGGDDGGNARRTARRAAQGLVQKVREHPVPAALAGAGLAYMLFFEDKEDELDRLGLDRRDMDKAGLQMSTESMTAADYVSGCGCSGDIVGDEAGIGEPSMMDKAKDKVSGAASSVKDSAAGAASAVGGAVSRAGSAVRDSASTAAEKAALLAGQARQRATHARERISTKANELASRLGDSARHMGESVKSGALTAGQTVKTRATDVGHQVKLGYQASRQRASEITDEYPLAVGAAVLGLGMLLGLALPRTRREDQLVGEKADQVKDRAKATSRDMINRGVQVAQITAEQTIDEARRQGLTPSTLIDKAKRVAGELKDAASQVAEREELTPSSIADKAKAVAEHAKGVAAEELERQQKELQETNA